MIVTLYADAGAFLSQTHTLLEQNEAANGLILGTCLRMQAHPESTAAPPLLAAVADDANVVVAAAMMTPPYKLVLCAPLGNPQAALFALARNLIDHGRLVPGVHAQSDAARQFAEIWVHLTNANYTRSQSERIYVLHAVHMPLDVPGELRLATPADQKMAARWTSAFQAEALPHEPRQDVSAIVEKRIANRSLYLWDDDGPVSMAGAGRPTAHGITINLVYTPPERRRRGYASTCVAHLSQRMLEGGYAFCTLYTDLANPTSNHIYQALGYRPVYDIDEYLFIPTS